MLSLLLGYFLVQSVDMQVVIDAGSVDRKKSKQALKTLKANWDEKYVASLIDVIRFLPPPRATVETGQESTFKTDVDHLDSAPDQPSKRWVRSPEAMARDRVIRFLQKQTGQKFGHDLGQWRVWYWSKPYQPPAFYRQLKAYLYGKVDPTMELFFRGNTPEKIRLDEIDWGGVKVNGIPPLENPKILAADQASYLEDSHIIFGVEINGQARAYPKRILGWHEMALDELGGVPLALVYCTLCGTVIPYLTEYSGNHLKFGTSGLLYRSNKLMFDFNTGSLWSTLEGRPVLGPLADKGLQLEFFPVMTTTWGVWKDKYPSTTVLDLDTGYERDYDEGQAYRDYFSHDRLMFQVPQNDNRLPNKQEVQVFKIDGQPVAVLTDKINPFSIEKLEVEEEMYWIVSLEPGIFHLFKSEIKPEIRDKEIWFQKIKWPNFTSNAKLVPTEIPTHRAFWFAWQAQFPKTILLTPNMPK